jgi:hypothetical protein
MVAQFVDSHEVKWYLDESRITSSGQSTYFIPGKTRLNGMPGTLSQQRRWAEERGFET